MGEDSGFFVPLFFPFLSKGFSFIDRRNIWLRLEAVRDNGQWNPHFKSKKIKFFPLIWEALNASKRAHGEHIGQRRLSSCQFAKAKRYGECFFLFFSTKQLLFFGAD